MHVTLLIVTFIPFKDGLNTLVLMGKALTHCALVTLILTQRLHTWIHLFALYVGISHYLCPLCCSAAGWSWLTGPRGRPWAPLPPRTLRWQGGCPCLGRETHTSKHQSLTMQPPRASFRGSKITLRWC